MMLVGASGTRQVNLYDASGVITSGGTAQLIVPQAMERSSFLFENISDTNMFIEFGGARATAALTSGAVSSCSVTNAGFGYSKPPQVIFYGGGNTGNNNSNPTFISATLPEYPAPANPAQARCVMSGVAPNQTIGSIVIDNPGSGYASAPYVFLQSDQNDPKGCASPSATNGILIVPSGSYTNNGVACTTDAISVYCATTGKAFTFKFTV